MDEKIIFSALDQFGFVEVSERGSIRQLKLGTTIIQSSVDMDDSLTPQLEYIRAMLMILAYPKPVNRALVLGVGGGSLITGIQHCYPEAEIIGVERSPAVIRASSEAFPLPQSERIKILNTDAESFMHSCRDSGPFDLIFIDLYDGDGPMDLCAQLGFALNICRVMGEDARLAINLWRATKHSTRTTLDNFSAELSTTGLRWILPGDFNLVQFFFKSPQASNLFPAWRKSVQDKKKWPYPGANSMMDNLSSNFPYLFGSESTHKN